VDEPGVRHDFTARELRVVDSIAAQAAVALENAQRYQREHRIAETLQQALMVPPEGTEKVDLAYIYKAASPSARVGGDFYDVFELDDERLAIVVGDVSGKGVAAASLTALLRDGVRAYLLETADPGESLTRLNTLVDRFTSDMEFATGVVGVLNHSTGELRYCNAAHPAPIVVTASEARTLECRPSTLLGAFPNACFESHVTTLAPGDVLLVVTDGITEARRAGTFFGSERLLDAAERLRNVPIADLPGALLDEVMAYADGRLADDVVIVCASIRAQGAYAQ